MCFKICLNLVKFDRCFQNILSFCLLKKNKKKKKEEEERIMHIRYKVTVTVVIKIYDLFKTKT
jgi:hypothetical protein